MKLKSYMEGNRNKFFKIKIAFVLIWATLLFYFSIGPVSVGENVQSFLIPGLDHIFAYFILSYSLFLVLLDFKINYIFFITIIISFLYGFGMEVIQGFLPWRDFSINDSFLNLIGSLLIVMIKPLYF